LAAGGGLMTVIGFDLLRPAAAAPFPALAEVSDTTR
jgi:hypothetical protein